MSWTVDNKYIRVDDNGILTFKAPPVAAAPAKKKKEKENLPKGVPTVDVIIKDYIENYGGGTVGNLKAQIQNSLKGSKTQTRAGEAVKDLKKFLEEWFKPLERRGIRDKKNKWTSHYQLPPLDKIQEHLGHYLQDKITWSQFLKYGETSLVEQQNQYPEDTFTYFKELVQNYDKNSVPNLGTVDKDRWRNSDLPIVDTGRWNDFDVFVTLKVILDRRIQRKGDGAYLFENIGKNIKDITNIQMYIDESEESEEFGEIFSANLEKLRQWFKVLYPF